ncbi:hypothetical protein ACO0SA_004628 [Hanseniaspora valbyensis]
MPTTELKEEVAKPETTEETIKQQPKEEEEEEEEEAVVTNTPIADIPQYLKDKYKQTPIDYDEEKLEKFELLRGFITSTEKFPVKEADAENFMQEQELENMTLEALAPIEIKWLTEKCLYRYLRASKWALDVAKQRLVATIAWRREFGIVKLKEEVKDETERKKYLGFEDLSIENETGKQVLLGYDNELRPILYLKHGRKNTDPSDRLIQHSIFMIERCIDLMDEDLQEQMTIIIDFKKNYPDLEHLPKRKPAMHMGRKVQAILQTHYPERLGKAYLFNIHWLAKAAFAVMSPFMDQKTRAKFNVDVSNITKHIPKELLDKDYGGSLLFKYEHEAYWPALEKITLEKRSEKYKDIDL